MSVHLERADDPGRRYGTVATTPGPTLRDGAQKLSGRGRRSQRTRDFQRGSTARLAVAPAAQTRRAGVPLPSLGWIEYPASVTTLPRIPIVLEPGAGRRYEMDRIVATFMADEAETASSYAISTWRLDAHTTGPGAHSHPEDDVFFVTEGTMSFLIDDHWMDAPTGTFVLVPGGTTHDFENRSDGPATALNVKMAGDFELDMPNNVAWFRDHPPGRAAWPDN